MSTHPGRETGLQRASGGRQSYMLRWRVLTLESPLLVPKAGLGAPIRSPTGPAAAHSLVQANVCMEQKLQTVWDELGESRGWGKGV